MINILPYNQKKLIARIRTMRMATYGIWSSIVLIVIAGILFLPTLKTVNSRYVIAQAQMHRLEQQGAIASAVDVVTLDHRISTLKQKLAAPLPVSPMKYIETVQANVLSGITITGYYIPTADKPIMQVRGVAVTRTTLQQFVATLQSDPMVVVADSPVANFVKSNQSEFTITITFKSL